jgi:hypothetical protein
MKSVSLSEKPHGVQSKDIQRHATTERTKPSTRQDTAAAFSAGTDNFARTAPLRYA